MLPRLLTARALRNRHLSALARCCEARELVGHCVDSGTPQLSLFGRVATWEDATHNLLLTQTEKGDGLGQLQAQSGALGPARETASALLMVCRRILGIFSKILSTVARPIITVGFFRVVHKWNRSKCLQLFFCGYYKHHCGGAFWSNTKPLCSVMEDRAWMSGH